TTWGGHHVDTFAARIPIAPMLRVTDQLVVRCRRKAEVTVTAGRRSATPRGAEPLSVRIGGSGNGCAGDSCHDIARAPRAGAMAQPCTADAEAHRVDVMHAIAGTWRTPPDGRDVACGVQARHTAAPAA